MQHFVVTKSQSQRGIHKHVFKLLYNLKIVQKQMRSVSKHLLSKNYWKTQTSFCYPLRPSSMAIEIAGYQMFIFKFR